jgi:anthranilate synthase component 2
MINFIFCKNTLLNILLIDNYDSFTYNIVELLKQCKVTNVTVVKNDEITIEFASTFSHIILSPGPNIPSQSGQLLTIIKALYTTHPILGICLGHQAIAEVFGASLLNFNHPKHGVCATIETNKDVLFENLPTTFKVGLYHSWYVSENNFPNELDIIAKSDDDIIMAIRHKQYNIRGVQFHPESYMTEFGKEMMLNWLGVN